MEEEGVVGLLTTTGVVNASNQLLAVVTVGERRIRESGLLGQARDLDQNCRRDTTIVTMSDRLSTGDRSGKITREDALKKDLVVTRIG